MSGIVRPYASPTKEGLVYYIGTQFGGVCKIGTTVELPVRIRRLERRQPAARFEVLATEPGGIELERRRHRQFAAAYFQGEWYWMTDELRQHIAALKGAAS